MDDLRVVLAHNPSPLTGPGTNTFLVGRGQVALIDPGPDIAAHRAAILAALGPGEVISHIFVTHAHLDHSEGTAALADATGAQVYGFGPAGAGRSPLVAGLELEGGEGIDRSFAPDVTLRDGQEVAGPGWHLRAVHTPGHMGNHLSFWWEERDALFCGDVVLGWASTLISPPEGDLVDYFRSLAVIAALAPTRLYPAHGDPVTDVTGRLAELAAHRRARTAEILAALTDGPADAASLAARIYDIPAPLLPAAARNVLAHLLALEVVGAVNSTEGSGAYAKYARV